MRTIIEFERLWVGEYHCTRCGTCNRPTIPFFPTEVEQHTSCISCGQIATIYQIPDDSPEVIIEVPQQGPRADGEA